jgi:hypothetical protein
VVVARVERVGHDDEVEEEVVRGRRVPFVEGEGKNGKAAKEEWIRYRRS